MESIKLDITAYCKLHCHVDSLRLHLGRSKKIRGHTDLNHGPIGLQPIALPLSYIPTVEGQCVVWAPDTARGPLSVEAGIFTRWSLTWPHVWVALLARPVSVELSVPSDETYISYLLVKCTILKYNIHT